MRDIFGNQLDNLTQMKSTLYCKIAKIINDHCF